MITTINTKTPSSTLLLTLIIPLQLHVLTIPSNSQQQYVNNNQLNCYYNFNNTNGFICNGIQSICPSYITFRSNPPNYSTTSSIALLLDSNASAISELNGISDVDPIPEGHLVVVPVTCACTRTGQNTTSRRRGPRHYQHNACYRLQQKGETYFSMSNDTYQGLTTCQAMMGQNPYDYRSLLVGDEFLVPIMCACPTSEQARKYGAKYLVSYLVTWGDDIQHIADMFGVNVESVLDANELKVDEVIFPFTPILVPLKSEPTKINLS